MEECGIVSFRKSCPKAITVSTINGQVEMSHTHKKKKKKKSVVTSKSLVTLSKIVPRYLLFVIDNCIDNFSSINVSNDEELGLGLWFVHGWG